MPGFVYFLNTARNAATEADLLAAGLGYALDAVNGRAGRTFQHGPIPKGPDGAGGIILSIVGDDVQPRFDPDNQDWQLSPAGYWVGVNRDAGAKPGEADLRRKRFIDGEKVELVDGGKWTVPVARSIVRGSSLPRSLVLGPDGKSWVLRDLPEFVAICADAESIWNAFVAGNGKIELAFDEQMRIALAALQVNYRIGAAEASLLGLLNTDNKWDVLLALVDYPAVVRVGKELAEKKSLQSVT